MVKDTRTDYQHTEAQKAVRTVSDFVNNYAHSVTAFVSYMAHEHRTLQQSFTRLCLAWLKHLASLNEYEYDLRNEHSVQVARLVAQTLRERYGPDWDRTPLI
jgi:hypothetical protein